MPTLPQRPFKRPCFKQGIPLAAFEVDDIEAEVVDTAASPTASPKSSAKLEKSIH
jgi:hypothetical protein